MLCSCSLQYEPPARIEAIFLLRLKRVTKQPSSIERVNCPLTIPKVGRRCSALAVTLAAAAFWINLNTAGNHPFVVGWAELEEGIPVAQQEQETHSRAAARSSSHAVTSRLRTLSCRRGGRGPPRSPVSCIRIPSLLLLAADQEYRLRPALADGNDLPAGCPSPTPTETACCCWSCERQASGAMRSRDTDVRRIGTEGVVRA